MEVEFVIRGYPSRVRFADWQEANTLPDDQLKLTPQQKKDARKLRVPERAYAVGIKAAEFAGNHTVQKMEQVAGLVAEAIHRRYPGDDLRIIVWDFVEQKFRFVVGHRVDNSEREYALSTEAVDDLLLEKEGAERRLKHEADLVVGGGLIDAMTDREPTSDAR